MDFTDFGTNGLIYEKRKIFENNSIILDRNNKNSDVWLTGSVAKVPALDLSIEMTTELAN